MRNTWILGRGRPESQEGETKAANGRAHDISETISHLYATARIRWWDALRRRAGEKRRQWARQRPVLPTLRGNAVARLRGAAPFMPNCQSTRGEAIASVLQLLCGKFGCTALSTDHCTGLGRWCRTQGRRNGGNKKDLPTGSSRKEMPSSRITSCNHYHHQFLFSLQQW